MTQAIPEQSPLFSKFSNVPAAQEYRAKHGGWLFVPDDASGAIWFDIQFTARAVMLHPAAKGNGRLI